MKYVTFIKELTKKYADILPYILMLSVILDVLFFRSQIFSTSRLNHTVKFHNLHNATQLQLILTLNFIDY